MHVVVLHAILARNARGAKCHRIVVERLIGPDELRELVFSIRVPLGCYRVAPAEVVKQRHAVKTAPCCDIVAYCLVDGEGSHVIRIKLTILRADTMAHNDALDTARVGPDHSRVARAFILFARKRLHDGPCLYLMIILADNIFLAADIPAAKHCKEEGSAVCRLGRWLFISDLPRPCRAELHPGITIMQEIHVKVRHRLSLEHDVKFSGIGKLAEHGGEHVHLLGESKKPIYLVRVHSHRHTLLRLGEQYFPWIETMILERGPLQMKYAAVGILSHFAYGRGKPSCTVIGYGSIEALVPRQKQKIGHPFLRDGVTDLHSARW